MLRKTQPKVTSLYQIKHFLMRKFYLFTMGKEGRI